MSRSRSVMALLLSVVVGSTIAVAQPGARAAQPPSPAATASKEVVLFPFDDYSIPLTYGLSSGLIQGHREGVVLRPGKSGPDAQHVINHGSVLRIDGQFRMWYLATGDQDPTVFMERPEEDEEPGAREREAIFRICYATSQDGINWEKPALGLVDY